MTACINDLCFHYFLFSINYHKLNLEWQINFVNFNCGNLVKLKEYGRNKSNLLHICTVFKLLLSRHSHTSMNFSPGHLLLRETVSNQRRRLKFRLQPYIHSCTCSNSINIIIYILFTYDFKCRHCNIMCLHTRTLETV